MIYSGSLVVGLRPFATVTRHVEVTFVLGVPQSIDIRLVNPQGLDRGNVRLERHTWPMLHEALRRMRHGETGELASAPLNRSLEVVASAVGRDLALAIRTINGREARGKAHSFGGEDIVRLREALAIAEHSAVAA